MKSKRILKCNCSFIGFHMIKECKYHETHCHFGFCKRKLKSNEYRYCKEHDEVMTEWSKDIDANGGSDF